MRRIIVIYGPPASGKYTIGKKLKENIGGFFFHNHLTVNLCKDLFPVASSEHFIFKNNLRLYIIEQLMKQTREDIIFTIFYWGEDALDCEFMSQLQYLSQDNDYNLYFFGLNPSIETLKQRVVESDRKSLRKPNTVYDLDKAMAGWKFKPIEYIQSVIIDNTALTINEVCNRICSVLRTN